jgi:AraC-like DNA-binding protein
MRVLSTMTGTPRFLAETPPEAPKGADGDVLSEMLRAVRLTGSVFLDACFTAPFGVESPKHFDDQTPMAHLRHISVFHLIAEGRCMLRMSDGETRTLSTGDILLLPFADRHWFWNGVDPEMTQASDVVRKGMIEGMWTVDHGGGGVETRMVCGYIESSELMFAPVFRTLPALIVERASQGTIGGLLTSVVAGILALVRAATPGTQIMLGRMMELLFVEVLRRHASRLPADSTGWFAALRDPIVTRALQMVHARPAERWTAESLARAAGTSRTVLGERFNALLGRPPMDYVAGWRIQLAADRLRNGGDSIATIAADVGYESEPAFNRAFKRITGVTPGRWRSTPEQAFPHPTSAPPSEMPAR